MKTLFTGTFPSCLGRNSRLARSPPQVAYFFLPYRRLRSGFVVFFFVLRCALFLLAQVERQTISARLRSRLRGRVAPWGAARGAPAWPAWPPPGSFPLFGRRSRRSWPAGWHSAALPRSISNTMARGKGRPGLLSLPQYNGQRSWNSARHCFGTPALMSNIYMKIGPVARLAYLHSAGLACVSRCSEGPRARRAGRMPVPSHPGSTLLPPPRCLVPLGLLPCLSLVERPISASDCVPPSAARFRSLRVAGGRGGGIATARQAAAGDLSCRAPAVPPRAPLSPLEPLHLIEPPPLPPSPAQPVLFHSFPPSPPRRLDAQTPPPPSVRFQRRGTNEAWRPMAARGGSVRNFH